MILVEESILILNSIESLIEQLNEEEYLRPLEVLSQNSLSQHIRHILEFYHEYILGLQRGEIDFDLRNRSRRLEEDRVFSSEFISILKKELVSDKENCSIVIRVSSHEKEIRPLLESSTILHLR